MNPISSSSSKGILNDTKVRRDIFGARFTVLKISDQEAFKLDSSIVTPFKPRSNGLPRSRNRDARLPAYLATK